MESANNLAILLRAGALPAKLTPIEQRVVGPGLGQDSIKAGETASIAGAILVVVFMLATYGLFGLFANIAVAVNVAMIIGVLSLLSATLTLPGIAGIVLTVGIAVDFERSHLRTHPRGGAPRAHAYHRNRCGFRPARSRRSSIPTSRPSLLRLVLFMIGTGPVRGFAVTLGVGILTTLFTAFTLTRLIVAWWVRMMRPQAVPI